jgi:hypothetical protein
MFPFFEIRNRGLVGIEINEILNIVDHRQTAPVCAVLLTTRIVDLNWLRYNCNLYASCNLVPIVGKNNDAKRYDDQQKL